MMLVVRSMSGTSADVMVLRDHAWSPFDHKAAAHNRRALSNCLHHRDILIKSRYVRCDVLRYNAEIELVEEKDI